MPSFRPAFASIGSMIVIPCMPPGWLCDTRGGVLVSTDSARKRIAGDWPVVFPMHPRTRKMCGQFGISLEDEKGLRILDPIGYHDSLFLTEAARFVLTDSGGLQEESTYFKTPCLTLRPNTERPVTITHGSNKLTTVKTLDADIDTVLKQADLLAHNLMN